MKFFLSIVFFFLIVNTIAAQTPCPIIPSPAVFQLSEGELSIPKVISVSRNELPDNVYKYLKDELNVQHDLSLVESSEDAMISFVKLASGDTFGYSIKVDETVTITYNSDAGAFYAINSLLQLVQPPAKIRKCFVNDTPRFIWRGLHLDVSRHFFSVEEVKRYIDLMALYKFNTLHWHLTDDQGWRIEIKKYPKLTEIGGYRDSTVVGHYNDVPRKYKSERYGGYYQQEEIQEIVQYAADRYITVVPEIEMPGHSRAALAAYPEYSCTGEQQEVPGLWGIFDDIYCSKTETIDFMKDILDEVLDLFPSEYIHIGGDEAPKSRWKNCENCQQVIKENGLKDEHELQSHFIRQIDAFLTSKGRKLIGWDEILEGGLSPNAAVMSWRGEKGGIEAAKQKHEVVMTPTTYCYFDYYQSSNEKEPVAIGGYLPLEKVYQFDPVPKELTEEESQFVLGGQANLWTEYIPSMEHLEYMTYPRALAMAQSVWCVNKPDYNSFLMSYLNFHEDYLERHNVHYAKSIHYPTMIIERNREGVDVGFSGAEGGTEFQVKASTFLLDDYYEGTLSGNGERIFIGRPLPDGQRNYRFEVTNAAMGDTLYFGLSATLGLGFDVELLTKPHPKYNHNGSLNLVDGIKGATKRWKGSEWLGFREPLIEIVMDMQSIRHMTQLNIGFLEKNGSWIYLPETVEVSTSESGEKWSPVLNTKVNVDETGEMKIKLNEKTQFIKLSIKAMDVIPEGKNGGGHIPWTFIDEIEPFYIEK